jgi:hypothetical protein
MAQMVSIEGQQYLRRQPLGVLGLSFITLGIYFLYWYYKVNDELRRFNKDDTISPVRSLMAMIFGWIIIVPPFIAMYNTAKHLQATEQRLGIQPELEPALAIVIMLFVSIGNGVYLQEHLNRVWDRASGAGSYSLPAAPAPPPPPVPLPPAG